MNRTEQNRAFSLTKLFLIMTAIFLAFSFTACPQDGGEGGVDGGKEGGKITAPVTDLPNDIASFNYFLEDNNYYIITDDIPNSSVVVGGSDVTITLGAPKTEKLALATAFIQNLVSTGVTTVPATAKIYSVPSPFYSSDTGSNIVSLSCIKDDRDDATLVYADTEVEITGTGTSVSNGVTTTYKFDISLDEGWNYISRSTSGSGTAITIERKSSSSVPDGFKWKCR